MNFFEKTFNFSWNQPEIQHSMFKKFAMKTLNSFIKLTPCFDHLSETFFRKNPQILMKLNHNSFHSLLMHEQHYTYNLDTKTCCNRKLLNIDFDQEFKNYNFIIEWILKFKTHLQFICPNAYIRPVISIFWTPKLLTRNDHTPSPRAPYAKLGLHLIQTKAC